MPAFGHKQTLLITNLTPSTNRPRGHGIGLAVVGDIARFYGGEVSVGKSAMGGAEITVTIAPHPTA